MPRHLRTAGLLLALLSLSAAVCAQTTSRPQLKHLIVMISDGCGYSQIEATSLYLSGRPDALAFQRFPVRLGVSTFSRGGSYDPLRMWQDFTYAPSRATDSAAAATALACGVKTYDAAIGGTGDGKPTGFLPVKNLLERAEELGQATGVVTSVQWSHATPACFAAHCHSRGEYARIAQQMLLSSQCEVIMGAGHPWFDNNAQRQDKPSDFAYVGGEALWKLLSGSGAFPLSGLDLNSDGTTETYRQWSDADGDGHPDRWKLVQTLAEFRALATGTPPRRVCGTAQVASTLQQSRGGDAQAAPFAVPFNPGVPTLVDMTRGALHVLAQDPDGFALMIEGGAVDWAGHGNQSGRLVEEELDFAQSVQAVVDWVERYSHWTETLLLVTGDHETGFLWGPGSGPDGKGGAVFNPLVNHGAGRLPGMQWGSGGHSNSLLPVFAIGRHASYLRACATGRDPVHGPYLDNTQIAEVCFRLLGGR